jgi:hypothetical protein
MDPGASSTVPGVEANAFVAQFDGTSHEGLEVEGVSTMLGCGCKQ